MARRKSRMVEAEAAPAGRCVAAGGAARPLTRAEAELVAEGWRLKRAVADAEERLRETQERLWRLLGPGVTAIVPGLCRVTTSERQVVTIAQPDVLREALGARFHDLVREETVWRPEPRLLDLAADADAPESGALRQALAIRTTPVVTWRAEA